VYASCPWGTFCSVAYGRHWACGRFKKSWTSRLNWTPTLYLARCVHVPAAAWVFEDMGTYDSKFFFPVRLRFILRYAKIVVAPFCIPSSFLGQVTGWGRSQWGSEDRIYFRIYGRQIGTRGSWRWKTQKQLSSTKASSVRSKLLLQSGNLSRLTLWWVTADRWLRATSTPSSKSLIYKKEKKTSSSPIMWHRYAKRTIRSRRLCPSSSRCKEVRGQLQRGRGRTLGTLCTCEEIERGTHACKDSKLGPVEWWWTQDGKLGITNQDPPPESGRRTHLLYFTYSSSYCILSCVWKLATSLLVLRYYEHLYLFSMLTLHVTSSRFCLYLLNIYHFTYTFSHVHTEAHTHKHTCTISTQEEWRQLGTGAWLRGAEERLC